MRRNILSQSIQLRFKPTDIENIDMICDQINENRASFIRDAVYTKINGYLTSSK